MSLDARIDLLIDCRGSIEELKKTEKYTGLSSLESLAQTIDEKLHGLRAERILQQQKESIEALEQLQPGINSSTLDSAEVSTSDTVTSVTSAPPAKQEIKPWSKKEVQDDWKVGIKELSKVFNEQVVKSYAIEEGSGLQDNLEASIVALPFMSSEKWGVNENLAKEVQAKQEAYDAFFKERKDELIEKQSDHGNDTVEYKELQKQ